MKERILAFSNVSLTGIFVVQCGGVRGAFFTLSILSLDRKETAMSTTKHPQGDRQHSPRTQPGWEPKQPAKIQKFFLLSVHFGLVFAPNSILYFSPF
jgi:hypothetical protein